MLHARVLLGSLLAGGLLLAGVLPIGPAGAGVETQPDVKIGLRRSGPYLGDDLYHPPGDISSQSLGKEIARGDKKTFFVKVQCDGTGAQFDLLGSGSGNSGIKWKVLKGFTGTKDITAKVANFQYSFAIGAGETRKFRVIAKVKADAPDGSSLFDPLARETGSSFTQGDLDEARIVVDPKPA